MDFARFVEDYGLILLLVVLLVFMFWSSRRRMQKQKAEQEERARQTVPGAEVLLQGGLYGTIVAYDAENLDQPAIVELAPGVQIKVHSQAILRVVSPNEGAESLAAYTDGDAHDGAGSTGDDHAFDADGTAEDPENGTKPQA